jgi:hypothetical protein
VHRDSANVLNDRTRFSSGLPRGEKLCSGTA